MREREGEKKIQTHTPSGVFCMGEKRRERRRSEEEEEEEEMGEEGVTKKKKKKKKKRMCISAHDETELSRAVCHHLERWSVGGRGPPHPALYSLNRLVTEREEATDS